jgi:hypothetical protein
MDFTKDFGFVADVAVGEEAHEAQPARVVGVMAATSSTSLRAASVSWSGLTRASTPWLWAMLRGFEPLFQVIKRGQGSKGSRESYRGAGMWNGMFSAFASRLSSPEFTRQPAFPEIIGTLLA